MLSKHLMNFQEDKVVAQNEQKHFQEIDLMKVWACIAVLVFHVTKSVFKWSNLDKENVVYSIVDGLIQWMHLYHVPVFFFCSGFLFFRNPICLGQTGYWRYVKKKLISLGIPFVTFSLLYVFLSSFLKADENHRVYELRNIWELFTKPVAQYWYLLTLFEILMVIPLFLWAVRGLKIKQGIVTGLFLVGSLYIIFTIQGHDAIFLRYIFFFLLGGIVCVLQIRPVLPRIITAVLFLSGLVLCVMGNCWKRYLVRGDMGEWVISSLLIFIMYLLSISLVDSKRCPFTIWVKPYTLHIFLIHTWIIGVIRIVLVKLGVVWGLQIILVFIGGFILSFLCGYVIKKIYFIDFFVEPYEVLKKERAFEPNSGCENKRSVKQKNE